MQLWSDGVHLSGTGVYGMHSLSMLMSKLMPMPTSIVGAAIGLDAGAVISDGTLGRCSSLLRVSSHLC